MALWHLSEITPHPLPSVVNIFFENGTKNDKTRLTTTEYTCAIIPGMNENTGAAPQLNIANQKSLPYLPLRLRRGVGEVVQPETRDAQRETRDPGPVAAPPRRVGGQPGNQNARKNGLYAKYLAPKQRQDYDEARGVRGVEAELALFRCKLAEMLETEPWNWALLNRITKYYPPVGSRPAGGTCGARAKFEIPQYHDALLCPCPGRRRRGGYPGI